MKHIMMSGHDNKIYHEFERSLRAYYKVTPLTSDSYLQVCTQPELPELILLTISSFHTEDLNLYNDLMNIPEMIGTPVIFLVEGGNLELAQQMLEMGAQDYILLPITPELLLHRISTFLELMNLRKERPFVEKYEDAISISFAELVECRDLTTGGHLKNTRRYFHVLLEEAMGSGQYSDQLPVEDTNELLRSVILHDIGKIGINDEVLRKESSLDFNEFEYMKTHTTLGKQAFENIIREAGPVKWLYMARDMAYCHHERWDGTGYPNGLKGEEIPLSARILAIADVYDALTSDRAYKKAFSHEKATQIILEGKSSMFDPDLVDLFMNVNEKFEEILNHKIDLEYIERE